MTEKPSIKFEPAYLAENEERVLATGYIRGKPSSKSHFNNKSGSGQNRWNNGRGSTDFQRNSFPRTCKRKKINPVATDVRILTCKCCGSFRHLIANCPDRLYNSAKVNIMEDEHAMLFTGYNKAEIARLGVDAQNCAAIDSACISTVCGRHWLNAYLKSLDSEDRDKIYQTGGVKMFRFGEITQLNSEVEYSIPAVIAGKHVTIKTDVVNSDIPLLLSRTAMKNVGVRMDLEHDRAEILNKM